MEARLVAGRYRLVRPLGRGGMGAVWLGEDELAGRQVAVKELRPPAGVSPQEEDVFRRRALAEARSAARLTHPNAVTLHDIIPASGDDDAIYLIMEYVEGATLAQLIADGGPLPEQQVAGIAQQMLSILEAAHGLGIVHRDIKPANIMITPAGQVKLADFGIAHVVGGTRLTGSGVIGTPAYMAPEQLQGLPITPAVDCWSLGATLYDAVAGRNPFDRETTAATFHAILMADLPPAPCGPPLADVIGGLLIRDPAQRMPTEGARALLSAASTPPAVGQPATPANQWPPAHSGTVLATSPGTPPPGPTVVHPPRRRTTLLAGGAVAAVVVIAAVVIAVLALHRSHGGGSPTAGVSAGVSATASTSTDRTPASTVPASTVPASSAPASSAPASLAASGGSGTSAGLPKSYKGHWKGTLDENNGLQGPQTADLKLTGGAVNAIVGTSSYTGGPCSYNLRLVSSNATQVELHEEVTAGACLADYAIISLKNGKLTENVYTIAPSGSPDFTGTLAQD